MRGEVSKQIAIGTGICGVLLLICGIGCVVSGFLLIGNDISTADGLWSGILILIGGVLGVITWWKRNRGVITGFLIVSIFAIVALFIQSIVAGVHYSNYKGKAKYCGSRSSDLYCNKSKMDTIIASLLAIVIFNVIGGIASFTGSIYGCMGTCCSTQTQPGTVIVQTPVVVTNTSTLPGYPAQPGYSVQQPGYFVQQPGYSAQQPGYSAQQPGHQATQSNYQVPQSGYQAPGSNYQAPSSGYQAPQPAYTAPQAGSYQQEVSDDPPPAYSKFDL